MRNIFFIHDEAAWSEADLDKIKMHFDDLSMYHSSNAAIGEGAGGPGWGTVIEVVLQLSAAASLGEQIWRIAKFLTRKKPKPKAPPGHTEIYRLVVHVNTTIISINLLDDSAEIYEALSQLDESKTGKVMRLYQNKAGWDEY